MTNSFIDEYVEIPVVLKLKKNIAQVGKLIAEYHYKGSFDAFVSEEVRQAIIATLGPPPTPPGPREEDYPSLSANTREYINKLLQGEEI